MGRPATGNRGISLRKGDYVVGAAVTPSNEARNRQRLERAREKGLSSVVEAAIDEAGFTLPNTNLTGISPLPSATPLLVKTSTITLALLTTSFGCFPLYPSIAPRTAAAGVPSYTSSVLAVLTRLPPPPARNPVRV